MTPATTALPPREAIAITTARGETEPARHFGPVDCVPVMNVVEFEASVAPWYVRLCSCDELLELVRVFWLNTLPLPRFVCSSILTHAEDGGRFEYLSTTRVSP